MEAWISKKELLQATGISYGQLYRWKREKLIPDAWFYKRSAFTGQETYFPRALALERVRFILAHKDEYSLTQLKSLLTPDAASRDYALEAVASMPNAARSARIFAAQTNCASLNHGQALSVLISGGYDAACAPADEDLARLILALNHWEQTEKLFKGGGGRISVIVYNTQTLPIYTHSDKPPLVPDGALIAHTISIDDVTRTYTKMLNQIYGMR